MHTDVDTAKFLGISLQRFGPEALALIGEIDEFKGAWPALARMPAERLIAAESRAISEAIGASCRIEGIGVGESDVQGAPSEAEPGDTMTRHARVIAAALESVAPISEGWIRQLHRDLLMGDKTAGAYKTLSNPVEAFDADGKGLGIVFRTAPPADTPQLMTELVAWLNAALEARTLHPLLVTAIFVAVFLEIHPFASGSTRLAMILATVLLVRAGYGYARHQPLACAIEENKYSYYLSLRRTLATLRTDQPDWRHWFDFFFRAAQLQKRTVENQIASDRARDDDMPALSAKILAIASETGRVTIAAAADATGISRNTIKDHVGRLAEQGHLTLHGAGRGAWYGLR